MSDHAPPSSPWCGLLWSSVAIQLVCAGIQQRALVSNSVHWYPTACARRLLCSGSSEDGRFTTTLLLPSSPPSRDRMILYAICILPPSFSWSPSSCLSRFSAVLPLLECRRVRARLFPLRRPRLRRPVVTRPSPYDLLVPSFVKRSSVRTLATVHGERCIDTRFAIHD